MLPHLGLKDGFWRHRHSLYIYYTSSTNHIFLDLVRWVDVRRKKITCWSVPLNILLRGDLAKISTV